MKSLLTYWKHGLLIAFLSLNLTKCQPIPEGQIAAGIKAGASEGPDQKVSPLTEKLINDLSARLSALDVVDPETRKRIVEDFEARVIDNIGNEASARKILEAIIDQVFGSIVATDPNAIQYIGFELVSLAAIDHPMIVAIAESLLVTIQLGVLDSATIDDLSLHTENTLKHLKDITPEEIGLAFGKAADSADPAHPDYQQIIQHYAWGSVAVADNLNYSKELTEKNNNGIIDASKKYLDNVPEDQKSLMIEGLSEKILKGVVEQPFFDADLDDLMAKTTARLASIAPENALLAVVKGAQSAAGVAKTELFIKAMVESAEKRGISSGSYANSLKAAFPDIEATSIEGAINSGLDSVKNAAVASLEECTSANGLILDSESTTGCRVITMLDVAAAPSIELCHGLFEPYDNVPGYFYDGACHEDAVVCEGPGTRSGSGENCTTFVQKEAETVEECNAFGAHFWGQGCGDLSAPMVKLDLPYLLHSKVCTPITVSLIDEAGQPIVNDRQRAVPFDLILEGLNSESLNFFASADDCASGTTSPLGFIANIEADQSSQTIYMKYGLLGSFTANYGIEGVSNQTESASGIFLADEDNDYGVCPEVTSSGSSVSSAGGESCSVDADCASLNSQFLGTYGVCNSESDTCEAKSQNYMLSSNNNSILNPNDTSTYIKGVAHVEGRGKVGSISYYGSESGKTAACSSAWRLSGTLCDDNTSYAHSETHNYKSSSGSGATWGSPSGGGSGLLVVDLLYTRLVDRFSHFQMFSDGRVSHLRMYYYHDEALEITETPDASEVAPIADVNDTAWKIIPTHKKGDESSLTEDFHKVNGAGSHASNIVTNPDQLVAPTPVLARYLMIEAKNDGSVGNGSYLEIRSVKAFGQAIGACSSIARSKSSDNHGNAAWCESAPDEDGNSIAGVFQGCAEGYKRDTIADPSRLCTEDGWADVTNACIPLTCAEANGGCGDPLFNTCTDNPGAAPICEDKNECVADSTLCSEANLVCVNKIEAVYACEEAPPTCERLRLAGDLSTSNDGWNPDMSLDHDSDPSTADLTVDCLYDTDENVAFTMIDSADVATYTSKSAFTVNAVDMAVPAGHEYNNLCKYLGEDWNLVVPRNHNQLSSIFNKYPSARSFMPGISTVQPGNYTSCKMMYDPNNPDSTNNACLDKSGDGKPDWYAIDDPEGRWFIRDVNYGEPNGDFTAHRFLTFYGVDSHGATFNDGTSGASGSRYVCSPNDVK